MAKKPITNTKKNFALSMLAIVFISALAVRAILFVRGENFFEDGNDTALKGAINVASDIPYDEFRELVQENTEHQGSEGAGALQNDEGRKIPFTPAQNIDAKGSLEITGINGEESVVLEASLPRITAFYIYALWLFSDSKGEYEYVGTLEKDPIYGTHTFLLEEYDFSGYSRAAISLEAARQNESYFRPGEFILVASLDDPPL